jgi:ADP-ribose pyrophosphatase
MGQGRVVSSRRVYDGRVVQLDVDEVDEPGGVRATREVVRHQGSVAVLPVHADGRIVLVRQYRYPVDREVWEIPAGRRDPGEEPLDAARRELEEEAGLRPAHLEPLVEYDTSPGFCDEVMHLFRATSLQSVPPRPDDDERIEVVSFPLEAVQAMVAAGEIRDAKTILALTLEAARERSEP